MPAFLNRFKVLFFASRKFIVLFLLVLVSFTFFYFHLYTYLTLDTLKAYQALARHLTAAHYETAVFVYLLIFTGMVACAIPCATVLTLIGGFLFGLPAILYAEISTTAGGLILFLSVRSAIGPHIAARSAGWLKYMEQGFQSNAFHYLLTLRLVPIFPCWISNVASGVFNIPIRVFVTATMLGILPATIIYVLAGRSLDRLLLVKMPVLDIMFTPSVFLPLLGLAFLSLFPVIYKRIKKRPEDLR